MTILRCVTLLTISDARGDPSKVEKVRSTHGRYGAVKGNIPRKFIRTCSFLLMRQQPGRPAATPRSKDRVRFPRTRNFKSLDGSVDHVDV